MLSPLLPLLYCNTGFICEPNAFCFHRLEKIVKTYLVFLVTVVWSINAVEKYLLVKLLQLTQNGRKR